MTRYAIYFAPARNTPWHQAACRWLGRDACSGAHNPQMHVPGIAPEQLYLLTTNARRYGFHATLKAPFRLREDFTESHLLAMAQEFADAQRPAIPSGLAVTGMSNFLALRPDRPIPALSELAMRCVSYFDLLRAPPSYAELARRRSAGLTARQEALLLRWGYPYTEEEFRFHLTLTDSLAGVEQSTMCAIEKAAQQCFSEAATRGALVVDALTVFREDAPGAPFVALQRFPFKGGPGTALLPTRGRLLYVVGPSGAGKDTLLRWVEERANDGGRTVFARRTITRAAHPSELYETIDVAGFLHLAAAGRFSIWWQANDLYYGIRQGIEADLAAGRNVVVNGSREYIPQLRQRFPDACVIWIDAAPEQIKQRIEARQRESGPALLRRMERASAFAPPSGDAVLRLDNSGPVAVAGERLLQMLARS